MIMNPGKLILIFDQLQADKNSRYKSWYHCYEAFSKLEESGNEDLLALNLGFYLASWGMYRGSSGLLQKDYKIHSRAVSVLKKYQDLRCEYGKEVNENHIDRIKELVEDLKRYYSKNKFEYEVFKRSEDGEYKSIKKTITATDTLISKIILGTLGCLPAFDRYFLEGIKRNGIGITTLKESLPTLFQFYKSQKGSINEIQSYISNKGIFYPKMKIIDLYFWKEGFSHELELEKLRRK